MSQGSEEPIEQTRWPHSPSHLFMPGATYIVTAGTHRKERFFHTPERLTLVQSVLFEQAERFRWNLQAWSIMQNHYHLIAQVPEQATRLRSMIQAVHSLTARAVNREDGTPGRKIWFQYWDTCLTNEKSYLARLHYVHTNPAKHGLVAAAENYAWCSMGWFLRKTDAGFQRTVLRFPCDRISIRDDF